MLPAVSDQHGLTEYGLLLDGIQYSLNNGLVVDPKLLALKEAYESGAKRIQNQGAVKPEFEQQHHRPAPGQRCGNGHVRFPSPAQVKFIEKLLLTRVLPTTGGQTVQVALYRRGGANLRVCVDLITWLLTLPERSDVPVDKASPKQVAFIRSLGEQRENGAPVVAEIERGIGLANLTGKQAREIIDALLSLPKLSYRSWATTQAAAEAATGLESGIYKGIDGKVYKVYLNQTKTYLLSKVLVVTAPGEAVFEYVGGATRNPALKGAVKLDLEAAKAFGAIYGVCCHCGRTLTDEGSIAAGIGPVCARNF